MLRRLGRRTELTIGRKHRAVGRLWHSGTKFNPRQHNCPREHCHTAGRHHSECSWAHITEWALSERNHPWVYFPERVAGCHNAGVNHAGLDIAEWDAGYDDSWLDVAERYAEYDDSRIYLAQWDTEYDDAWVHFAQ